MRLQNKENGACMYACVRWVLSMLWCAFEFVLFLIGNETLI